MKSSGNTILVTGGGSGIGRSLAVALHDQGNTVVVAGRRVAALQDVADAYPGIAFEPLDVADRGAIPEFADRLTSRYPALNVLINNAGVMMAEDLTADHVHLENTESMIATNLLGPVRLIAAFLPHLRAQASSTILNVSSGLAFVPLAATPTYSATKAAIHSYSDSLRHQLRNTTVEVIEIAPPAVATDLMPGHAENPTAMQLDAYIAETMEQLRTSPHGPEILVERVTMLRNATRNETYPEIFAMLNSSH